MQGREERSEESKQATLPVAKNEIFTLNENEMAR